MSDYRPGLWRSAPPSGRPTGRDILCGNVRIAAVSAANPGYEAHALLIAASPELFAALRAILAASAYRDGHGNLIDPAEGITTGRPLMDALSAARAALIKAGG